MHALWVLVVAGAAAVGAAGGAERADARIAALATAEAREAAPALRTAAVYPALHAITVRPGRLRGARALHPSLPPVTLAAGWSLAPLRRAITEAWLPVGHLRADRSTWTGCARGPPIG